MGSKIFIIVKQRFFNVPYVLRGIVPLLLKVILIEILI